MRQFQYFILLFAIFLQSTHSAKILFYHLFSSYSHRIAVWPLVEALADKGHEVTFLQAYPPKTPHPLVREFYPKTMPSIWEMVNPDGNNNTESDLLLKRLNYGPIAIQFQTIVFPYLSIQVCDRLLSNPEMHEFVNTNDFDLVIVDALFNECVYGLAHLWGAKTIIYHTAAPSGAWGIEPSGFLGSAEPWISDNIITTQMPLTFLGRVKNFGVAVGMHLFKELIYYPKVDTIFEKRLNVTNFPSIKNLIEKTSLVFYNSHWSEGETRSLSAKYVAVPALHAWDSSPQLLPKNISDFIDGSGDDGFIYMSFGGEVNFNGVSLEFQNIFVNVFSKLKSRVLWKKNPGDGIQIPSNVFAQDWMPQKDILASPKCRGFITHGGLLGMQESILAGVPMIVMPIWAEQELNADRVHRTGRGIKVEPCEVTEEILGGAIEQLLSNNSYKEEVDKVRRHLRAQQNKPLDTAVFWTEYILTHDLPPRPRAHNLYWFQVYFVDVFAFLFVTMVTSFIIFFYTLKLIYKLYKFVKASSTQKLKTT